MKYLVLIMSLIKILNFNCVGNGKKGPKNFYQQKKFDNAPKGKTIFLGTNKGQQTKIHIKSEKSIKNKNNKGQ